MTCTGIEATALVLPAPRWADPPQFLCFQCHRVPGVPQEPERLRAERLEGSIPNSPFTALVHFYDVGWFLEQGMEVLGFASLVLFGIFPHKQKPLSWMHGEENTALKFDLLIALLCF